MISGSQSRNYQKCQTNKLQVCVIQHLQGFCINGIIQKFSNLQMKRTSLSKLDTSWNNCYAINCHQNIILNQNCLVHKLMLIFSFNTLSHIFIQLQIFSGVLYEGSGFSEVLCFPKAVQGVCTCMHAWACVCDSPKQHRYWNSIQCPVLRWRTDVCCGSHSRLWMLS